MATTNPKVDSIVGYVEQHTLPLLGKSILGAKAPRYFNLMTGVKGKTALNIMDADPALQCGNTCGFDPETETTFTQRYMEVTPFKVNMTFCDKNLLDTWANYEVKVAAGLKNLPFEEEWTAQIVEKVQEKLEAYIWQGGEYCGETAVKGIVDILADAESIHEVEAGATMLKAFMSAYLALPAAVQAKDDVIIFTTYQNYNVLVQDILSASHYHLDVTNYEDGIILPGTRVKVVPTGGLPAQAASKDVLGVIGRAINFVYGTDMRGDEEKFDLWYSKDNREFRLAIEFTAGAQVAFPDEALLIVGA